MKKTITKILACGLCVTMLGGCSNQEKQSLSNVNMKETTETAEATETMSIDLVEKVKTKYAGNETIDYAEPMYNVEKDHVFTYENLPEKFFEQDEWDCFAVYSDSDLKNFVDITIDVDCENKSVTIAPNMVFCYGEEGSVVSDGTWGSRSKFWLVQNIDLETGEMLSKPIVTVFTTKEEMNTPTLEQKVNEEGVYTLSWSEVEGADYYEVYEYRDTESAFIEVTTENTSCTYNDFNTEKTQEERFEETYTDTEVDVTNKWIMNVMLDTEQKYFVVARSNDGKKSGMSNLCEVEDIGNQIPYMVSDEFVTEYEGDNAMALPAYVDVEMKDGSIGKFLIEYHGAKVTLLADGSIFVECTVKNLPIEMQTMTFTGMEYEDFLTDMENVTKREDELATKSVTTEKNVNVPYLPDKDYETSTDENVPEIPEGTVEPEGETMPPKETVEPIESVEPIELETAEPIETIEPIELETAEPIETIEPIELETVEPIATTAPEETQKPEEIEHKENDSNFNLSEEVADTVYANSSLSEWIALNMLGHQEEIYLADFPESSDSEKLIDAIMEAYTQNPLIGIMSSVDYNYEKNVLEVGYVLSAEETSQMQEESLKKAEEIVSNIIQEGMSDYEKEEAINQYICENGTYNEEIMDYINNDGTIDSDATIKFANSFTPYGILVENIGVCESYSEAFLLLAKKARIDAVIVTGTLDGVNHEWNRVNIDGQWYSMDTTNNDCDNVPNCYFNLPDELAGTMLLQDKDAFIDSYVSQYTAENMDNEYYTKNSLVAYDASKAAELLAAEYSQKDMAAVRVQEELDESSMEEIVENACNKAGVSACRYYYRAGVLSMVKE